MLTNLYLPIAVSICLLLAAAISMLRSKQPASKTALTLQLFCLAALFLQLAAIAFSTQLISGEVRGSLQLIGLGLWLTSMVRLLEIGSHKPFPRLIKSLLFIGWLIALAWSIDIIDPPIVIGYYNARTLNLPYIALVIALLLLAGYALGIRSRLLSKSRHFLWGTLLYSTGALTILPLAFLPSYDIQLSGIASLSLYLLAAWLFCVGAIKHPPKRSISLSRKAAFYGISVIWITLFFLLLGLVGSFTQHYVGRLVPIIQFVVIALACVGVTYLTLASNLKNRLRVYVEKNFFRHKYDYRSVWLNLINTFSNISENDDFFELSIRAVGDIFQASGGAIWINKEEQFELAASWNANCEHASPVSAKDPFIGPFNEQEWIYAPGGASQLSHDRHLNKLPEWLRQIENLWIVAPLTIGKNLVGFFMLTKAQQREVLIWEDIDVIKSTGRQLASYIVRQRSAEELAQSKQFDAYNKLTAFIMHDLKNLIAQQALVVENAQKHKENPAFVEDAIRTIDNSVERMNHLLKRLQRSSHQSSHRSVSVRHILTEAIRKSADRQPIPTLRNPSTDAYVVADQDQIVMVLMHLIRNAQDATKSDGFIDISLDINNAQIYIDIEDNGCGMDENFLKNRLFKPFESTKSSMGMGIGAYQVKEFIESMGGKILVTSQLDAGTTVCIQLPIAYSESSKAS